MAWMNTTMPYQPPQPFVPHRIVRDGTVQTLLSTYRPRGLSLAHDHPVLLDAGPDQTGWDPGRPVRLHGYFTPSRSLFGSRGLALVLHGWEGHSHSVYNLVTADTLVRAGFDVFRLNVRDHGPGLHLNPYTLNRGFFMATLLDEIAVATERIAEMAGDRPFYIIGASMGGNLALRLALRHSQQPFHKLHKVIAFNPVLNAKGCARRIDAQPHYLRYFRRRWLRSLLAKQQLFPELYDFTPLRKLPRLIPMTEWLIERYGDRFGLESADQYFAAYSLSSDAFQSLTVRTTIITAANDQVVPVEDFYALEPHPLLDVHIHSTGGHVGYVDLFPLRHNVPRLLLSALWAGE
jgi:predicted alpha/beta-fold hydrolase